MAGQFPPETALLGDKANTLQDHWLQSQDTFVYAQNKAEQKNRAILEQYYVWLQNEIALATQKDVFANIPARLGPTVNHPIRIYGPDNALTSELPLNLAIRLREPRVVRAILMCFPDVDAKNSAGKSAIDVFNQLITSEFAELLRNREDIREAPSLAASRQLNKDIRLKNIRSLLENHVSMVRYVRYQLAALALSPLFAISLLSVGGAKYIQPAYMMLSNVIKQISDFTAVIGAAYNSVILGRQTHENREIKRAATEIGYQSIKPALKTNQQIKNRQSYATLRYGLLISSYTSLILNPAWYKTLLTASMSLDAIKYFSSLRSLWLQPFMPEQALTSPVLVGRHFSHKAKLWKTLTQLIASIAYTVITTAWFFAPMTPTFFLVFGLSYLTAFAAEASICNSIDKYFNAKTHDLIQYLDRTDDTFEKPELSWDEDAMHAPHRLPGPEFSGTMGKVSMFMLGYLTVESANRIASDVKENLLSFFSDNVISPIQNVLDSLARSNPDWTSKADGFRDMRKRAQEKLTADLVSLPTSLFTAEKPVTPSADEAEQPTLLFTRDLD